MLFLLSFVVLLGAAVTGALLAVDAWAARSQTPGHLQYAHHQGGHDWTPHGAATDGAHAADTVVGDGLPAGVRARLWVVFGVALAVGVALLLASV